MKVALCSGSFDPITNGHLDIIERAAQIFDKVLVTVFHNLEKKTLFTMEERVDMIKKVTGHLQNVEVDCFEGLLCDYARRKGAKVLVRGLRAISDFEYEFQIAQINKKLNPDLETMFMMTRTEHSYLSSSIVKEIASLGGCVRELVPAYVADRLREKFAEKRREE